MFNNSQGIRISGDAHNTVRGNQNNATNNNRTYNQNSNNQYSTTSSGPYATIINGSRMASPNDIPRSQYTFASSPAQSSAPPEAFNNRDTPPSIPRQSPVNSPESLSDSSSSSHTQSLPYFPQPQSSYPQRQAVPQQSPLKDDTFIPPHSQNHSRRRPRASVPVRSFSGYDGDISTAEGGQTEFESDVGEGLPLRKSNQK